MVLEVGVECRRHPFGALHFAINFLINLSPIVVFLKYHSRFIASLRVLYSSEYINTNGILCCVDFDCPKLCCFILFRRLLVIPI